VTLSSALDAAFLIALLTLLVKAGDFLLRPHQQRCVQSKMETATLWLDYRRPALWYAKIVNKPVVRLVGLIATVGIYALAYMIAHQAGSEGFALYANPIVIGVILLPLLMAQRIAGRLGRVMHGVMAGEKDEHYGRAYGPKLFFLRSLEAIAVLSIASVIVVGIAGAVLYGVQSLVLDRGFELGPELLVLISIVAFPFAIEAVTATLIFVVVCSLIGLIATCHVALIAIRAVCWRIVEYNKGAWAAILVIVTVMLGVLDASQRSASDKAKSSSLPAPSASAGPHEKAPGQ
jgi:hypothetical protein